MYLALFLTPWMAMYALSTIVFNHWEHFTKLYGGKMEDWRVERIVPYQRAFPEGTPEKAIGARILDDLALSGGFQVEAGEEGHLVITRLDPVTPRRITYVAGEKRLKVERQVFRTANFLTRVHSRLGYGSAHRAANIWAASVDLSVVATLLWVASGLWMWWELKATRRWGIVFAAVSLALFGMFLALS